MKEIADRHWADRTSSIVHCCRNCGAAATGNFCPQCGQETRESLPTLREFIREAMGRLVAFDGRLWRTMHALVFRPGFLTKVYLAGIRRRYVRPARLFLAMSLLLFAVIRLEVVTPDLSKAIVVGRSDAVQEKDSAGDTEGFEITIDKDFNIVLRGAAHMFLTKELQRRFDRFNRLPSQEKVQQVIDGGLRYGSYVAFLLLPMFAALQLASYAGSGRGDPRRPRLYAEHLIYATHLHTFGFMIAALFLVVPLEPIRWFLLPWTLYYVVRAKQVVYGGSWHGRVLRSLAVIVVYGILLIAATVGLVFVAILLR